MDLEELEDLLEFLEHERSDVRAEACKVLLSLTGTESGISSILLCSKDVVHALVRILGDVDAVALNAGKALVNISSNESARERIAVKQSFWSAVLETSLTEVRKQSEQFKVCMKLLNNMTISAEGAEKLLLGRLGEEHKGHDVKQLLIAFHQLKTKQPSAIDALLPVLTNVTQTDLGRQMVLEDFQGKLGFVKRILWCTSSEDEEVRLAAMSILRNCCFSAEKHIELMEETQLIDRILLPLVGPEGIEDDDATVPMPPLLEQRLQSEDVVREPQPQVRRAIVDILLMLSVSRVGRTVLRKKKCYPVIKAYHPEEDNEETSEAVFKLVDLLLGEEDFKSASKEELAAEAKSVQRALANPGLPQMQKETEPDREVEVSPDLEDAKQSTSLTYEID